MSKQRNVVIRFLLAVWNLLLGRPANGSFLSRQRRWVTAAIGALGVSGLILGGSASPAAAISLPSSMGFTQWSDAGLGAWTSGDLNIEGTNASTYAEGETVPFRLDVTSAGAGTFDFTVCRDYNDGHAYGYLNLQPYGTSRAAAIATGAVVTDAATGAGQPFTGAAVVGSVHIVSATEVGQGACNSGQRETDVRITISGDGLLPPVGAYVLWGGHLASPADAGVGVGQGASHYQGATLSMQVSAATKNLSAKVAEAGTITVEKDVDSGTATADQFCFNISPNPAGITGPLCPAAGSNTVAFYGLTTGSYSITEAGLTGYTFASGSGTNCSVVDGIGTAGVTAANIATDATCVFHNRRETGTITVNSVVDPSTDPGKFNLQIDGMTAGSGHDVGDGGTTGAITVTSGLHPVGDTAGTGTNLDDYTSSISCTDSNGAVVVTGGSVSVADGQNIVCTITLAPIPPAPTTSTTVTTVPAPVDPTTSTTVTTVPAPVDPTTSTTVTTVPAPVDPTTSTTVTTVPAPVDPTTSTTVTTVPAPVDPTTSTTVTTVPDPVVINDPLPTTSSTTTTTAPKHHTQPGNDDGSGSDSSDVAPTDTTPTTVDPGSTVAGGGQAAQPAPTVLGAVVEQPVPASDPAPAASPAPATPALAPAGTLPRTGTAVAREAELAVALLAAGLAFMGLARRRRQSPQR